MNKEDNCKCVKIVGHLEAVNWMLWPRKYQPGQGYLSLGDWVEDPHIWLQFVESCDGSLPDDDVLMSTDTRYWSIHDIQRYLAATYHCENILFAYQYPSLRMPTRLGSYFWRANTALKLPSADYQKQLHYSMGISLKHIEAKELQMDRLIISDQLIKLDQMDYFQRKTFFRILQNILRYLSTLTWIYRSELHGTCAVITTNSFGRAWWNIAEDYISLQDRLQLVSFENLCCKRLEGASLIQYLACFNAESLKYLFLWRFVLPNENPLLINYSYITGSGLYTPRPDTSHCFLRSLGELYNLRLLALEYSHIADGTGDALLSLLTVIKRPHFRLQLICREDQTPGRTDASLGVGGYDIPDPIWRRVNIACPDLYLVMAFFRIRDYDNVRRFLTPSIPLREVHLQLGIELKMRQRQDSDISCFVRHIAYFYGSTLVTLSLHQWRFAEIPLRRIFELMPRLVRFHYIGRVQDDVDLKRMLTLISCGVCDKLKQVKIQIQDDKIKRDYWQRVVKSLTEEYADIMELYDIIFCISVYKS